MRHDYARLPLRQAILLLAVPMVLEMIMESLFAVIYAFALFLGVVGIAFVLLGETIVRAFTPDPEVVRFGSNALRIISAGFLFYACGMVVTQAFNGAGDTRTPTLINLGCYWLWEIPLAWLPAGPLGLVPTGCSFQSWWGFRPWRWSAWSSFVAARGNGRFYKAADAPRQAISLPAGSYIARLQPRALSRYPLISLTRRR